MVISSDRFITNAFIVLNTNRVVERHAQEMSHMPVGKPGKSFRYSSL